MILHLPPVFRPLALLTAGAWLTAAAPASAQTTGVVTTLRGFNGVNGQDPTSTLTLGSDGNFYGTSPYGGANNGGTAFRVAASDGSLTLLHSFAYSTDGSTPQGKLLLASDGNFYGTTTTGGPNGGSGTVFRMSPDGTVVTLHTFQSGDGNGNAPSYGVIQGRDGNLYGGTLGGGDSSGDGTLFRLSLDGVFVLLHTFDFHLTGTGPYDPPSPPVQGSDGNFYGVASGGDNNVGSIYKLAPDGTVTTLHSFARTDGSTPNGLLVEDGSGIFYGVTENGGSASSSNGTIFKITSAGQFTSLHSFTGNDGRLPDSGLLLAADGNFYGTTTNGGSSDVGTLFQCTPAGSVTNLYTFKSIYNSPNGDYPSAGLTQAADGSFYGVTESGGTSGDGVAYRFTIDAHPPFFDGAASLGNGVEYLQFSNGNPFGYFSFLTDPHYIYHQDLGYEYVFDAGDGNSGVYLYDFESNDFFYTSPTFPFPYLYDFSLGTVLYYYPDPKNAGRYNTNGIRYFYDFATGKVITK